jgi:hypothetical protein
MDSRLCFCTLGQTEHFTINQKIPISYSPVSLVTNYEPDKSFTFNAKITLFYVHLGAFASYPRLTGASDQGQMTGCKIQHHAYVRSLMQHTLGTESP